MGRIGSTTVARNSLRSHALKTSNLTQLGKMNTKPEDYMSGLMSDYMEKVENENLIPYPEPENVSESSSKELQS